MTASYNAIVILWLVYIVYIALWFTFGLVGFIIAVGKAIKVFNVFNANRE